MDWWRYYLETSAAFSRSMHQRTLVGRLAVWKLQHSANVFLCSGVIWCCRFSRSTRRGNLVEILEVLKLQRSAHVFWCSGVIWCCCCHYVFFICVLLHYAIQLVRIMHLRHHIRRTCCNSDTTFLFLFWLTLKRCLRQLSRFCWDRIGSCFHHDRNNNK